MLFAEQVREELSEDLSHARHCKIAEIAGMTAFGAGFIQKKDGSYAELITYNEQIARKYFTYAEKTFNIELLVKVDHEEGRKETRFTVRTAAEEDAKALLVALKAKVENEAIIPGEVVYMQSCCKRAFLRGAFLTAGSMSDPRKGYHLEFVTADEKQADMLIKVCESFGLSLKKTLRKGMHVVYAKDSQVISDILNIAEAHNALMEFENVRIYKDVRNGTNRKVNCETANIKKTVGAAAKQVKDILYIQEKKGFKELPKGLRDIAELRLENPDSSLSELAEMLTPPIGRSGVNHRLQKLSAIADELRGTKEERQC